MLLEPRDYLSTYVKLGTIAVRSSGVFLVHPNIKFPMLTEFAAGGGPIIKGTLFPFLFVTIACEPSRVSLARRLGHDTQDVGQGDGRAHDRLRRDVVRGLVAVLALIAATSNGAGDYFAINTTPEVFSQLGLSTVHLDRMSRRWGRR